MSKYRNIPQATKDNVLHYINQVYDEAYELGYQRGRVQSDRDIDNAQRMIEDAIKNLHELKQVPKRGKWVDKGDFYVCSECGKRMPYAVLDSELSQAYAFMSDYCPHCGARMESDER